MKTHTLILLLGISLIAQAQEDKYLWLEEVEGKNALEFVEKQNKATLAELSSEKAYPRIFQKSLEILNSADRIAYPSIYGQYVYNFWQDKDHERGIWRRSTLASYKTRDPNWETLLDLDKLSETEGKKWVLKESSGLYPDYNRFLLQLSDGGGDAVYIKEFDVVKKQFVENGFSIPEAKGTAEYMDANTLMVTSDFGQGTMTSSGYPRQVKIWKHGTLLKDAQLVFEGKSSDMGILAFSMQDGVTTYNIAAKLTSFYSGQLLVWKNDKLIPLAIPEDVIMGTIYNGQLVIQDNQFVIKLKSDWSVNGTTYKAGALISLNFTEFLKGTKDVKVIYEPDEFSSIAEYTATKNKLLVNVLTDVTSQLYIYSFKQGKWVSQKVEAPKLGAISVNTTSRTSDEYFFDFRNFVTPTTLYIADANKNSLKAYKSLPSFFDGSKYQLNQYKTKSKDGTLIPYFMVSPKNMKNDSSNPTLIYAYGGFEDSQRPTYLARMGASWLDNGGVFVMANIRGRGEYGPMWHQNALKEKRQNAFDDLYAVSEDLISKKVTSPKHLGVWGGSNGGLLVGVAFTQRPDLYNAVVCEVPLLDMQRYSKLLAGASWIGEYGDPDIPEEWAYLKKYSPYHNLKMGLRYPEVFFMTSTQDDRVHPGHARKMTAKMNEMGYKTYYYENTEGGHAGTSTNQQSATRDALMYTYLLKKL